MIRFIHLSDVHLGAVPDRGCPWSHEREEEIWETFRRVIVGIRKNPVDLLFIAGDLFHRQPLLRELREVDDLSIRRSVHHYMMNGNLKISLAFMCCSHMAVKSDIVRWILQGWQRQDLII